MKSLTLIAITFSLIWAIHSFILFRYFFLVKGRRNRNELKTRKEENPFPPELIQRWVVSGCWCLSPYSEQPMWLEDQVSVDQYRGKIKMLLALSLLGIAYSILLYYPGTLTGTDNVDGIIGVVFGLYMCSYPAAFIVDLLISRRHSWHEFSSSRSTLIWIGLNMLALLIGWLVIFLGTIRLIGKTGGGFLWG